MRIYCTRWTVCCWCDIGGLGVRYACDKTTPARDSRQVSAIEHPPTGPCLVEGECPWVCCSDRETWTRSSLARRSQRRRNMASRVLVYAPLAGIACDWGVRRHAKRIEECDVSDSPSRLQLVALDAPRATKSATCPGLAVGLLHRGSARIGRFHWISNSSALICGREDEVTTSTSEHIEQGRAEEENLGSGSSLTLQIKLLYVRRISLNLAFVHGPDRRRVVLQGRVDAANASLMRETWDGGS